MCPLSGFLNLDAQRNHEATQAQVVGTPGSKFQSEEIAKPHRMGFLCGLNEKDELIHEINNHRSFFYLKGLCQVFYKLTFCSQ